ncbi:MAG TPA: GNAT family N-acetyltransferase [Armatimonadota bacterium]|nr:GNAT family N-acetyltransferase [Armatimonadota bacterium]
MPTAIRPAVADDMPRLQEIVTQIWAIGSDWELEEKYGSVGDESWDRWLVPKVMSRLWDEIAATLVTEVDGEIAGFISHALNSARRVGSIHFNGVAPEFRGNGIGTRQVEHVLGLMREAGMEIAAVGTGMNDGHAPARRVYEKAGFEPVIEYRMYAQRL